MSQRDTASLCPGVARPRTGFRRLLALTAGALATLAFAPLAAAHAGGCGHAHTPIPATSRGALQRAVVCLINQQRRDHGLPTLDENSRLNRSAQGWTNEMVSHRVFTHGADFAGRITAAGFHWSTAGENIATGYVTPAAVVAAWMASADHCRNILSPVFGSVGTGVNDRGIPGFHTGPGTWTQDFALLMGQRAPSHDYGPAAGCPYR